MSGFRTLDDVDVKGKRVLLRVDLNVPMDNGRVSDTTRLQRIAKTIIELSEAGGRVVILAHFGRPKGPDPKESLKPVANALGYVLLRHVEFAPDCVGPIAEMAVAAMKDGEILCLENTRFHSGEERTIRHSSLSLRSSATSGSTTLSLARIAPTPQPRASAACCRAMPAAPWKPSSMRSAKRWKSRSIR